MLIQLTDGTLSLAQYYNVKIWDISSISSLKCLATIKVGSYHDIIQLVDGDLGIFSSNHIQIWNIKTYQCMRTIQRAICFNVFNKRGGKIIQLIN